MGNVVAEEPTGHPDRDDRPGVAHAVPAEGPRPAGGPADGAAPADPDAAAPAREAAGPAAEAIARVVEFAARPAPGTGTPPAGTAGPVLPGGTTDVLPPAPADPADAAPDPGRRRARGGPGKRELRHRQTRGAIVDAAAALFTERGFDAVSVLEIARRAGVVEKTVFNHFPVKEGLVFEADPPIRAALVAAVRGRPAGESAAAAAGSFVVAAVSQLGSPAAAEGVAGMARVIRGSRTLQVREREILGALTDALAGEIARETAAPAGALEPWLAAHAVLGLYAGLLELARDRVLAGGSGPELVEELRTAGRRGLALLQFGLAGYAKRRG